MKHKFKIGDTVYLITDRDQEQRLVTGITQRTTGFQYGLSLVEQETWHYEFEIAAEKDTIKALL